MIRASRGLAFCAALLTAGLIAKADDSVANPAYDSWSKAKVGTVVKFSTTTEAMGTKTAMETTDTLKEVTPDAVKVEIQMSMTMAGTKTAMPPTTTTYPAKIAKPADTGATAGADTAKPEESKEDVTIAGKTYACKVTTVTYDKNGMKGTVKSWTCADVPGGVVKTESSTTGTMTSSSTMELTGVEEPK